MTETAAAKVGAGGTVDGAVDSHTHLLPERLASKIRAFFDEHLGGQLAYPDIDPTAVLDRHHADGVAMVWTLPYAHKAGMAAQLNVDIAALAAGLGDHPVEVIPGATAHPDDPDPGGDVARALAAGAGVVKLHCSVGDYVATDPRLDGVWAAAAEAGVPVVVHAGHNVSGNTDGGEVVEVARAAERHPDTIVIVAHTGHPATDVTIEWMDRLPNLWADLTPVVTDPVTVSDEALDRLADRFLFGSDAPNTGVDVATLRSGLANRKLRPEAIAGIMGGNARRLTPSRRN